MEKLEIKVEDIINNIEIGGKVVVTAYTDMPNNEMFLFANCESTILIKVNRKIPKEQVEESLIAHVKQAFEEERLVG